MISPLSVGRHLGAAPTLAGKDSADVLAGHNDHRGRYFRVKPTTDPADPWEPAIILPPREGDSAPNLRQGGFRAACCGSAHEFRRLTAALTYSVEFITTDGLLGAVG